MIFKINNNNFQFLTSIIFYYSLVSSILIFFKNPFFLKTVGALTSKSFAYKAWSWELSTTYMIDFTNVFNDKVWVDLKGLEIIWVLPWLDSSSTENWISDKTRFSYDGLSLNWVTKFYIKRKILLLNLSSYILNLIDPLQLKYQKFLKKNEILTKLWNFKTTQFSFYEYINFYLNQSNYIFSKFSKYTENLEKKKNNIFFIPLYLLIDFDIFNYSNFFSNLFENFFYFWKKLFLIKNNFLIKKFNALTSININKVPTSIILSFLILNKKWNVNFYLDFNLDALTILILKQTFNYLDTSLNIKKTKNLINYILMNFNLNLKFVRNKLSILHKIDNLKKFELLFLINLNLRVIAPKIHLILWKHVKESNAIIFVFGTNENILFKHLNFGFNFLNLFNLFCARSWVNSLIIKKTNLAFLINFESISFFFFKFFLINKNLCVGVNTNLKQKFFYLPVFYYYPLSMKNWINNLTSINFLFRNKKHFTNFMSYKLKSINTPQLNIFSNCTSKKLNILLEIFFKNFYVIKKNFLVLIESNITKNNAYKIFDFILPLSNITENFLIVKNFFLDIKKSLFIKKGPLLSRNLINYLKFFKLLLIYPFYFYIKNNSIFQNINLLFLMFWLEGTVFLKTPKKINQVCFLNANKNFLHKNMIKLIFFKIIQTNFSQNTTNLWYSEISYIKSSKYANLGYNLVKQEKKTFF